MRIIEENRLLAGVNDELCVTIYNKYKNVLDEIFDTVKNETPHYDRTAIIGYLFSNTLYL
ncbi:hypothetical protein CON82_24260 [Bacillus wiedmannii]|nr:hypothetical protein CON82_24260 [Bacillus wiedmannii]